MKSSSVSHRLSMDLFIQDGRYPGVRRHCIREEWRISTSSELTVIFDFKNFVKDKAEVFAELCRYYGRDKVLTARLVEEPTIPAARIVVEVLFATRELCQDAVDKGMATLANDVISAAYSLPPKDSSKWPDRILTSRNLPLLSPDKAVEDIEERFCIVAPPGCYFNYINPVRDVLLQCDPKTGIYEGVATVIFAEYPGEKRNFSWGEYPM